MFALNEKDEKPKILLSVHIYFHIYTKRYFQRRELKEEEEPRVSVCNLKHICVL